MSQTPAESVHVEPLGRDWPGLIAARRVGAEWSSPSARAAFRAELGLPRDGTLIATGHQAQLWHAGILAKYLAADAFAAKFGGRAAWLVVDHDTNDAHEATYVARRNGRAHQRPLGAVPVTVDHAASAPITAPIGPRPTCCQPPFRFTTPDDADPAIASSLHDLIDRVNRRSTAPNAAAQVTEVLSELLADLGLRGEVLFATKLRRTTLFRALLARMRRDPESCISAYNAAAAAVPGARMTPLVADPVQDRFELPLWRLTASRERLRVYLEDLDAIPVDELAPRALLLTGLMRLAGCDLFIHGLGGGSTTPSPTGGSDPGSPANRSRRRPS